MGAITEPPSTKIKAPQSDDIKQPGDTGGRGSEKEADKKVSQTLNSLERLTNSFRPILKSMSGDDIEGPRDNLRRANPQGLPFDPHSDGGVEGEDRAKKVINGQTSLSDFEREVDEGTITIGGMNGPLDETIKEYEANPGNQQVLVMTLRGLMAWMMMILKKAQTELSNISAETLGVQKKLSVELTAKTVETMIDAAKKERDLAFFDTAAEAVTAAGNALISMKGRYAVLGGLMHAVGGFMKMEAAEMRFQQKSLEAEGMVQRSASDTISKEEAATEQKMQERSAKFYELLDTYVKSMISIFNAL